MIQKQHEGQRRAPQSDDLAFEVCQPEAQVSQGDGAPNGHEVPVIGAGLHDGAHAALQRYLGQDVVPQIAQHAPGVGQLGAAQVDLVVCHHPHELKDLLPAGDKARAERVVDAEGLARRGGRRVHNVRELLLQLQIVQNEAVAVVGYAEAVRGFAIRGSSEVGADPGGQPGARVGAFRKEREIQRAERGVYPAQVEAAISRQKAVRDSDLVDGQPGVALQVQGLSQVYLEVAVRAGYPLAAVHVARRHAFSKEATLSANDGRLDCCDGGAGDVLTLRVDERGAGEQLLAQEAERRSHRLLFPVQNALRSASGTFDSLA